MESIKEGHYYHIYNRATDKNDLFLKDDDYDHFLKKYFYYLYLSVETYAYCLLRNHFHFLIRARTTEEQSATFDFVQDKEPAGSFYGDQFDAFKPYKVSRQFSHLMNSYTKSINAQSNRIGTLIQGSFHRKRITDQEYLTNLVCYIHLNPIHHGISSSYDEYPYSSYEDILNNVNSLIEIESVHLQFGGLENFIIAHRHFKQKLPSKYYLE